MGNFIKHLPYGEAMKLANQVDYLPGQVVSKTLVQNDAVGITLFAIPDGEGISAHKSPGDALVTLLEGEANITIDADKFEIKAGESIIMPAGHPHALHATTSFKMLLMVIFQ